MKPSVCDDVYECIVLHTAGWAAAVDGGHPQVGGASVKDDLEGLRRSSNGDDSIVSQLQSRQRGGNSSINKTGPNKPCKKVGLTTALIHLTLLPLTPSGVTYVSIIRHGLVGHGEPVVELGHGIVRVLLPVLLPQTLFLQDLPGSLTLL